MHLSKLPISKNFQQETKQWVMLKNSIVEFFRNISYSGFTITVIGLNLITTHQEYKN